MKFLILGATGGTGLRLIDAAIRRGHEVTALVRSPQKLANADRRLQVLAGDPLNVDHLIPALSGKDAVLSAFGPQTLRSTPVWQKFATSLVEAMTAGEVRRLLLVSVALLFRNIGFAGYIVSHTLLRNIRAGAGRMEGIVESADLDWTIVRPPRLTNGRGTGSYRVEDGRLPSRGFVISRADLAEFMLSEVEQNEHVRRIVGVSA